MFSRLILLTIAVSAAALRAVAQAPAPTTTAFDGKYAGVSRDASRTLRSRALNARRAAYRLR
jgi:hypothetical protein